MLHFLPFTLILHTQAERSPLPCHLLDPHDGVIKLRVYGLQVFECGLLIQHSLVEGQREARVDELSMVQSLQGEFVSLKTMEKNINWLSLNQMMCLVRASGPSWEHFARAATYCMAIWFKFAFENAHILFRLSWRLCQ